MVRFSCFQAHIHFHKHKKSVRLSDETMEKTSDDSAGNHDLGNAFYLPTEHKTCSKQDGDSPTSDRLTNSSPTERECKSEEIEGKYSTESNLMARNNAPMRKCKSLGSGSNWVEGSFGADDSEGEKEHKLSSDGCADNLAVVAINNCELGVIDQLQELVLSDDSVRVNSNFVKDTPIISIGNPQYYEEVDIHQDGISLSYDCTPQIQAVIAKSRSLPTMASPSRCSPSFLQRCRSVENLDGLECKNNVSHESGRQVQSNEIDDSVFDNDKVYEDNPGVDTCEAYEYVGSAKHWIMPVFDVVTVEKGKKAEASLCSPDETTPEDFRFKRIDDWVNNLQHYNPLEGSKEFAPFDGPETSKGKFVQDESTVMKSSEVKVNPGAEAAKKYISSLNVSAASAQLTNLGLVAIPFLSAFVSLKALNLSGNAIVRITAGALPRGLHILNLSKNSISTIEGLRDLGRLRVLDLSYNRIVRIGHGLSSCSSLKELYLAGNKISEVEGLHRLLKLNVLDLRFNKISTTKCLGQLAANYNCLQALSLEGNPSQKNVGDEQLKKYVMSLLPNLSYYNRKPVKAGTVVSKDSPARGLEVKKGRQGTVPSKASPAAYKRGHGSATQRPSRSRQHGTRLPMPSGTWMSAALG